MEGTLRRQEILDQLTTAEKPISASKFAQQFGVSRQIIVGDVALMRAGGAAIIATARGYILERTTDDFQSKIAVQHDASQTEEELLLIVKNGGEVVDVIVEHPLYGELVGGLHIGTEKEVFEFMKNYQQSEAHLLSQLTGGIHLHTIRYKKSEYLADIKAALAEKGILYEEKN